MFKTLLNPYRKDADGAGESLVIPNHIQQMQMWAVRKGLEFYPQQDTVNKDRKRLIERIVKRNRLDLYYKAIVASFLSTGGILWYLRPNETGEYDISWYDQDHYRVYRNISNSAEIEKAIIIYSYKDYSQNPVNSMMGGKLNCDRWIRIVLEADKTTVQRYTEKPSLDEWQVSSTPFQSNTYPNLLGFISCVESPNNPKRPGDSGIQEFSPVVNQILAEEDIRAAMLQNVYMFGNPTLVTSKSRDEVIEQQEAAAARGRGYSWSAQQGYQSARTMGTPRLPMPGGQLAGSMYGLGGWINRPGRISKLIGNVREGDRFAYLQVDPVSQDQWQFSSEYREAIHSALGGIDPIGKFGTLGEMKTFHGKVAATAEVKCLALWTYGLAKVLEMAVQIEENLFLATFAAAITSTGKVKPEELSADLIQSMVEQGIIPPGITGIPPAGDRTILWRYKGPVFEDSADDKLQQSIIARNLQELGVGSIEALRYLFPDKTEREIKALLTGVPFRYIQQTVQSLSSLLQLQQQMYTIADPQNPSLPMAARFDVTPIIGYTLNNLFKEISYGAEHEPVSPSSTPLPANGYPVPSFGSTAPSNAPALSAATGMDRPNAPATTAGLPPNQLLSSAPSVNSVPAAGLPSPGSTVDNSAMGQPPSFYPIVSPNLPPDIATNPALAAQLYPQLFSAARSPKGRTRRN